MKRKVIAEYLTTYYFKFANLTLHQSSKYLDEGGSPKMNMNVIYKIEIDKTLKKLDEFHQRVACCLFKNAVSVDDCAYIMNHPVKDIVTAKRFIIGYVCDELEQLDWKSAWQRFYKALQK